jgi:integrase
LASNPAKRSGTLARDEGIVRVHIAPTFGSRPIGAVTTREVQAAVSSWIVKSKPSTVRRQYGVLRAVFAFAVERDYIARTPCRSVRLPEVHHPVRPVIDGADLARLAGALGQDFAPMAYLGAALGLRWGEVAGLRVGRLDLLRETVSIEEQITRGERGRHVIGAPKSRAGRRTLTMPRALVAILAEHLARRGLTGADGDALLFVGSEGGPLRYERWRRRIWLRAIKSAELDGLTFHDLRRANATALVADGVDLKTAQARLGHSDPRLTLGTYAQATSEGDRAAADSLNRRFFAPAEGTRATNAP